MKIPNFDDKDLAIVGIVVIAVVGCSAAIIMKADAVVFFPFLGTCITGIAALATGRKKEEIKS